MTLSKRLLDLGIALLLAVVLAPVAVGIALAILLLEGAPVFYVSERMRSVDRGFDLWKFRTMRPDAKDGGVSGGHKASRVTRTGHFLRRYRLDEIPQLWNVIRGDISFVGPRPPLRQYVEAFPDVYGPVLQSRPGITGMATLVFHKTEERLLSECDTAEMTERVYCQRCIPRKARLDMVYARRRTNCSDLRLMFATVFRSLPLH